MPPVSVVICARNEAENLGRNLPVILTQQYHDEDGSPMYEVLVINDDSADDTIVVLERLTKQYSHLRYISVLPGEVREFPGKKYALSKAVKEAKSDLLLLTDADCVPASGQWLRLMTAPLAAGKQIVAGYGGYYRSPSLLNAFIRWETMHTYLQYSTYLRAGIPYMAVGRNMACTRQVIQQAQESTIWAMVPSGDDDLLVNIAGTATNTALVDEPEAYTCSAPKSTLKEWAHQKQRHLSTGKFYRHKARTLLGLYGVSHAFSWVGTFILLFSVWQELAVTAMLFRCIVYWLLWAATTKKLNEKDLFAYFPLFDLGWMIYNFAFLPYITTKNKLNWK